MVTEIKNKNSVNIAPLFIKKEYEPLVIKVAQEALTTKPSNPKELMELGIKTPQDCHKEKICEFLLNQKEFSAAFEVALTMRKDSSKFEIAQKLIHEKDYQGAAAISLEVGELCKKQIHILLAKEGYIPPI